jgi:ketosteroid isomerase-like protein
MQMKKALNFFSIFLCAVFFAAPVFAADQSDVAGRAVTWEKEYNANNLDAVVALYAADGSRMPPNQEPVKGSAGILAELKNGKEQGAAKVKVAVTTAESAGDMSYGVGTYELTRPDGSHFDHGKWMIVSKKVGAAWKILYDIWNSNMPLPASNPK